MNVLILSEYRYILVFLLFSIFLSFFIYFLSFFVVKRNPDEEKSSSYECGFNPFSDARQNFNVRFYLVAILFIVFDLEIVYFFPWACSFFMLGFFGFFSMIIFLFILGLAFFYEWLKGALDW